MHTLITAIFEQGTGDLVIPAWFIFVAGAMVAWMIWATKQLFQNKADIMVNAEIEKQFKVSIDQKFNAIEGDIKEVKDNVKEYGRDLKELSSQILQFLVHEFNKR